MVAVDIDNVLERLIKDFKIYQQSNDRVEQQLQPLQALKEFYQDEDISPEEIINKLKELFECSTSLLTFKPIQLEDADNLNFKALKKNFAFVKLTLQMLREVQLASIAWFCEKRHSAPVSEFSNATKLNISLLYIMFSDDTKIWSSYDCAKYVQNLMDEICKASGSTIKKVLASNHKDLLLILGNNFKSDSWKCYPVSVHALQMLLKDSLSDSVAKHLNLSAPCLLKIIDDYNFFYYSIGVQMLECLFIAIPAADMRAYGWSDVFYDVLLKNMSHAKHDIINVTLPALLSCLKTIQPKLNRKLDAKEMIVIDKTFEKLVSNTLLASDGKLINCYFVNLPNYIEYMGIEVIGHLKQLVSVYTFYLNICSSVWMLPLVDSLYRLMKVAWLRISTYKLELLQSLLKALVNIDHCFSWEHSDLVQSKIYECIGILVLLDSSSEIKSALQKLSDVKGWKCHVDKILLASLNTSYS